MSTGSVPYSLILIAVCGIVTVLIRALPFLLFGGKRKTPAVLHYLSGVLPCATVSMLVIYCLRNVTLLRGNHGLPELISCAAVVGLHVWRRNTLLSIAAGTILYMVLVQLVF